MEQMMESNVVYLHHEVDAGVLLEETVRAAIQEYGVQEFCLSLIEADEQIALAA
jgi:hypothetical protein